jgi:hypothetical protein
MFSKRSKKQTVKKKNDRGSLILMWFIITIGLTVGFNLAYYGKWKISNYIIASAGLLFYNWSDIEMDCDKSIEKIIYG